MSNKKLELTWIGKENIIKAEPRVLLEDKEKSYGDENAENMLIHGDNLLALKALEDKFTNKIKCIYIDPPFNTGAAFEYYNDNLEHSIWLNLMRSRFILLKNLLREDGIIWINLDDCESAYCKVLLDEVFGRNNYLNEIIVGTNKSFGFKSTSNGIFKQANHVLVYCKNKEKFEFNEDEMYVEKGYDEQYKWVFMNTDQPEDKWTWKNIKDVIAEEYGYESYKDAKKDKFDVDSLVPEYAIKNADRVFRTASVTGGALQKRKDTINLSKQDKNHIVRHPNDDMDYMFIKGERVIYYKERLKNIDGKMVPGELITDIWNDISVEGLANEGNVGFPKGKKPEKLIYRIFKMSSNEGDFVLDSFLGSGTTCAVAHKMNRKWIGIELENHCYTHCIPRIKNVVDGNDSTGITNIAKWKGGGGFKFYELAPSLLVKDKFNNWIISENYNGELLTKAICKQEKFEYIDKSEKYWKQGKSSDNDYIFVTTNYVSVEYLDSIYEEMQDSESLLICCKTYQEECENRYNNINIKKIPQTILNNCDYGKDDYSLNVNEVLEIDENE